MNNSTKVIIAILLLCMGVKTYSQCAAEQKTLDDLQKEFSVLFVDLEKQAKLLKEATPDSTETANMPSRNLAFDVVMKNQTMSFNVPKVTMKSKDMSFDVPQVTMKTKSFSVPTSTWKWKVKDLCCGMKTKQLVIVNGMKKVEFKSPEIRMKRTNIVVRIPEFTSDLKEIQFKIPEFTLVSPIPTEPTPPDDENLKKKTEAIAAQADTLSNNATTLAKEQKEKSLAVITSLFSCMDTELNLQKVRAIKSYDDSILQIDDAIKELVANGLNPASITAEDGTVTNMLQVKFDLTNSHAEIMASLDAAINELRHESDKLASELTADIASTEE